MKKPMNEEEFEKLPIEEKIEVIKDMLEETLLWAMASSMMKDMYSEDDITEEIETLLRGIVSKKCEDDVLRIGDKVDITGIIAPHYMVEFGKKKVLGDKSKNKGLFKNNAIVIEIGCEFEFKCDHCDKPHINNTLIYFPHNHKKYYIASRFLTIK